MNDEKKFLKPEADIISFCDEDIILTSNILDEIDEDNPVQH